MKMTAALAGAVGVLAAGSSAGTTTVSTYDDVAEGFYGTSWYYNGVTYNQVNNVHGVFPDGSTFEPGDGVDGLGDQVIVENAGLFYDDF